MTTKPKRKSTVVLCDRPAHRREKPTEIVLVVEPLLNGRIALDAWADRPEAVRLRVEPMLVGLPETEGTRQKLIGQRLPRRLRDFVGLEGHRVLLETVTPRTAAEELRRVETLDYLQRLQRWTDELPSLSLIHI